MDARWFDEIIGVKNIYIYPYDGTLAQALLDCAARHGTAKPQGFADLYNAVEAGTLDYQNTIAVVCDHGPTSLASNFGIYISQGGPVYMLEAEIESEVLELIAALKGFQSSATRVFITDAQASAVKYFASPTNIVA